MTYVLCFLLATIGPVLLLLLAKSHDLFLDALKRMLCHVQALFCLTLERGVSYQRGNLLIRYIVRDLKRSDIPFAAARCRAGKTSRVEF